MKCDRVVFGDLAYVRCLISPTSQVGLSLKQSRGLVAWPQGYLELLQAQGLAKADADPYAVVHVGPGGAEDDLQEVARAPILKNTGEPAWFENLHIHRLDVATMGWTGLRIGGHHTLFEVRRGEQSVLAHPGGLGLQLYDQQYTPTLFLLYEHLDRIVPIGSRFGGTGNGPPGVMVVLRAPRKGSEDDSLRAQLKRCGRKVRLETIEAVELCHAAAEQMQQWAVDLAEQHVVAAGRVAVEKVLVAADRAELLRVQQLLTEGDDQLKTERVQLQDDIFTASETEHREHASATRCMRLRQRVRSAASEVAAAEVAAKDAQKAGDVVGAAKAETDAEAGKKRERFACWQLARAALATQKLLADLDAQEWLVVDGGMAGFAAVRKAAGEAEAQASRRLAELETEQRRLQAAEVAEKTVEALMEAAHAAPELQALAGAAVEVAGPAAADRMHEIEYSRWIAQELEDEQEEQEQEEQEQLEMGPHQGAEAATPYLVDYELTLPIVRRKSREEELEEQLLRGTPPRRQRQLAAGLENERELADLALQVGSFYYAQSLTFNVRSRTILAQLLPICYQTAEAEHLL
jgi:hypothetical protein